MPEGMTAMRKTNRPEDDRLPALVAAFEAHLRGERRASRYTLRNYGAALARFDAFLRVHLGGVADARALERLEAADFRAFLAARRAEGLDAPTLKLDLSALRTFYRFLASRYGLKNDAISIMRGPRMKERLPRPVSAADADALIADAGARAGPAWIAARDAGVMTLLYGAGLRISEALALKRREAPFGEALRIAGKGGKTRLAPVLPAVREAVDAYLALCPYTVGPDGPLFVGARGGPLSPRVVQRDMARAAARLGLPETATPHALRHAFATELLARGGDLRAVQELLGHASILATQRYTKIDEATLLSAYGKAHPRAR